MDLFLINMLLLFQRKVLWSEKSWTNVNFHGKRACWWNLDSLIGRKLHFKRKERPLLGMKYQIESGLLRQFLIQLMFKVLTVSTKSRT